jgi:hypothetical protein
MEYTDRVKCWAVQQKDGLWTVEFERITLVGQEDHSAASNPQQPGNSRSALQS